MLDNFSHLLETTSTKGKQEERTKYQLQDVKYKLEIPKSSFHTAGCWEQQGIKKKKPLKYVMTVWLQTTFVIPRKCKTLLKNPDGWEPSKAWRCRTSMWLAVPLTSQVTITNIAIENSWKQCFKKKTVSRTKARRGRESLPSSAAKMAT